ncbi:hypothetical protein C0Z10_10560 [Acidipropionibacterium jensenii]|uniref:Uncharacterized protein n=2 Tax=Acidipropionibacterium jensenii TaxID=1749 RepID=A0A3T0S187_9ACTN|nr:hypothetical protein C0Z10_10560 [Acidipropionibacterium jensenii]
MLLVRVEHTLSCRTQGETEIVSITAAHIAAFRVIEDLDTTRGAVSAWIDANVYFQLYPYVRQFFTEMTTMLGLPPVTLDYLHRDLRSPTDAEASQPTGAIS